MNNRHFKFLEPSNKLVALAEHLRTQLYHDTNKFISHRVYYIEDLLYIRPLVFLQKSK
jgi:hypothetical protein